MFVGRSGSSYLITKLDSHPDICARGEELANFKEDGASAQTRWVREFMTPTLPGRNKILGIKTKLVDVIDPDEFAQVLSETQSGII